MTKLTMLTSGASQDPLYELQQTVTIMQQRFQPVKGSVTHLRVGRLHRSTAARESHANPQLPKAWALAGAFSLLTLALKLAQY
jgi:hypothetical protein